MQHELKMPNVFYFAVYLVTSQLVPKGKIVGVWEETRSFQRFRQLLTEEVTG